MALLVISTLAAFWVSGDGVRNALLFLILAKLCGAF